MPKRINPEDILPIVSDSLGTQQILYKTITDALSSFSDSAVVGYSFTASLSSNITESDFAAYTVPYQVRSLTDSFETLDVQNPQWPVGVYFNYYFTVPISGFFTGADNDDTVVDAFYVYTVNLPVTGNFTAPATFDTPILAILGSYQTDFYVLGTFVGTTSIDFNSQIIIQPKPVPTVPHFNSYQNFAVNIEIHSVLHKDFAITAKFRTPPIDIDTLVTARFAGNILINATNVDTGVVYSCTMDTDGFWHIDNVPKGFYIVTPILGGITFSPPSMGAIISNQSPTLYFTEVGVMDINNPFGDS